MGAPPVAEASDLSEWPRWIKSGESVSPKILSGTAKSIEKLRAFCYNVNIDLLYIEIILTRRLT
jgi:hypothetical protein